MSAQDLTKPSETAGPRLKVGDVIDVEARSAPSGCFSGDCLVHRQTPDVAPAEAWVLPRGETCTVRSGQAFCVLDSQDGATYTALGYTALAEVTLTGPLIWTEIETPEGLRERLDNHRHTVADNETEFFNIMFVTAMPVLALCFISATIGHVIASADGVGGLVIFAMLCAAGAVVAARYVCEMYGRKLLSESGGLFISEAEFDVPEEIGTLQQDKENRHA